MQEIWVGRGLGARRLSLPCPGVEVLPGVRWGIASSPESPAYWVARCFWPNENGADFVTTDGSLAEELGFCLLGGFGIRYEMNVAAFERLKLNGIFCADTTCSLTEIENLLNEPLNLGQGCIRYRFPFQRAKRIWKMRHSLTSTVMPMNDPLCVRAKLIGIDGVGLKTASWVVRNLFACDQVAILDVHVVRVCQKLKLFPPKVKLPRDYEKLEKIFLEFARTTGVSSAILDATIWAEARTVPAAMWRIK